MRKSACPIVTALVVVLATLILSPVAASGNPVHVGTLASSVRVRPPGLPQTGVQFGAYIQSDCTWTGCDRVTAQTNVETQQADRQLQIDHQFYLWDEAWPTQEDTDSAAAGRILILTWDPLFVDGSNLQWADIAAGVYDATIDAQATAIRAFPYPVWFNFHHEPTNNPPGGGTFGTPTDFVAAYQHIHDRFVADGVTNVRYLLILFADSYSKGVWSDYYPGDQYVDALGADGYNWYLCGGPWKPFSSIFAAFHNVGVQVRKPMIIGEWATGEDPADPNRKAQWITDALATVKTWPDVKAIAYFDTGKNPLCLRWINTPDPANPGPGMAAFATIGADPYANPAPDTTAPTATIDSGPPSSTTDTFATFTWSADELDVRYTCSLDHVAASTCYDFTKTYTGLAVGNHTFNVQAVDYSGNVGTVASWSWTIELPPLPVSVSDTGFAPQTAATAQGQTVVWTVDSGTFSHQITDASGMGLFTSPTLTLGQSWSFQFIGAGSYKYKDALHTTLTGTVTVPILAAPSSGTTTTTFTLTWASAPPPAGYVFDVQIQRPGSVWKIWKRDQTVASLTFVPDSGPGVYSFRAHIKNSSNGKSAVYSAGVAITVS
jgi:plastocyanin